MHQSNIFLRPLRSKDAEGMLEWMHDSRINVFFRFDADQMTMERAEAFIRDSVHAANKKMAYHYAITDETDEYLGTVSLKQIDWSAKTAEYAISLRRFAQGRGVAAKATQEALRIAFEQLHLNRIFLNVLAENKRAIRFYETFGFVCEGEFRKHLFLRGELKNLKWYSMLKDEYRNIERFSGGDNRRRSSKGAVCVVRFTMPCNGGGLNEA